MVCLKKNLVCVVSTFFIVHNFIFFTRCILSFFSFFYFLIGLFVFYILVPRVRPQPCLHPCYGGYDPYNNLPLEYRLATTVITTSPSSTTSTLSPSLLWRLYVLIKPTTPATISPRPTLLPAPPSLYIICCLLSPLLTLRTDADQTSRTC